MSSVNEADEAVGHRAARRRRWAVLGVVGIAQLMVVLALTVMNIALPTAQRALHFSTADRQWVITAYALASGSLLLAGGKLSDLLGRRMTFLVGLVGFAISSAAGGASVDFAMLVAARATQGVFAALLVPAALALLTTTFTDPKERAEAFGIFAAIATTGSAIGLLLGGALTDYLSWRWTLYVNVALAGAAFVGGVAVLDRRSTPTKFQLDIPGVLLSSAGMFCVVFGFSHAATTGWHALGTWATLVAGAALLISFAAWIWRAPNPILPTRIVLSRNRSGAYIAIFTASVCLFATLFFLTFYLQQTLHYSPIRTGLAFLPISACLAVAANVATIVVMPRVGPRPLVTVGLLVAGGAMAWLAHLGAHSSYTSGVLGPIIVAGIGLGMVTAPAINTGVFGVAPQDAGEASAMVNVSQQLGASIGTALLNTTFATAVASYTAAHVSTLSGTSLISQALAHGYDTVFWWACGLTAGGAVVATLMLHRGPLVAPKGAETLRSEPPSDLPPASAQAAPKP